MLNEAKLFHQQYYVGLVFPPPGALLPFLKLIKVMLVTDDFKGHLPVPSPFSEQRVIHTTLHQRR